MVKPRCLYDMSNAASGNNRFAAKLERKGQATLECLLHTGHIHELATHTPYHKHKSAKQNLQPEQNLQCFISGPNMPSVIPRVLAFVCCIISFVVSPNYQFSKCGKVAKWLCLS